jgi:hypothetical protein
LPNAAFAVKVRFVDHVVVKQGSGMDELHDRGEFMVMWPAIPARAGGEQHEGRTETLAPARDDVLGDLSHQNHVRVEPAADQGIDGRHVVGDEGADRVERGRQAGRADLAKTPGEGSTSRL